MRAAPSLAELRAENYRRTEAPVYKPIRRLSVLLSWAAIRMGVHPNVVTLTGLACAAGAAGLLASDGASQHRLAVLLILAAYVLDCMDGEVARGSGRTSVVGSQLDHVTNWVTVGLLHAGAAIGAYRAQPHVSTVLYGYLGLVGWYSFYFLFIQLLRWLPRGARFGGLRVWSRSLFVLMPLDENLVAIFALAGATYAYVVASAVLAPLLFAVTLALYVPRAIRVAQEAAAPVTDGS